MRRSTVLAAVAAIAVALVAQESFAQCGSRNNSSQQQVVQAVPSFQLQQPLTATQSVTRGAPQATFVPAPTFNTQQSTCNGGGCGGQASAQQQFRQQNPLARFKVPNAFSATQTVETGVADNSRAFGQQQCQECERPAPTYTQQDASTVQFTPALNVQQTLKTKKERPKPLRDAFAAMSFGRGDQIQQTTRETRRGTIQKQFVPNG